MSYEFLKRVLDLAGSVIAISISSPIMLLAVIAIKFDSLGPVLADTPMRVGKNGRLFKMYKFRSMVEGAYELLQKNPPLLRKYKENSYKLEINEDPRITRVGKFIRKTSIDELPQFFNILKGEMSLVGPRAYYPFELQEQQKRYPNSKEFVKIIQSAKPGLTGVWQVSGRSQINFDKRVKMDAQYVQKQSIFYDICIIFQTIPAVMFGKGAI